MFRLYKTDGTYYELAPWYSPQDLFPYEKDLSITRNDGSTTAILSGDGYYKPTPIKFTSKRRFDSIASRNTALTDLKNAALMAKYLIYENNLIWISLATVEAQATTTSLDAQITLTLVPTLFNNELDTANKGYYGYYHIYYSDTTITYAA